MTSIEILTIIGTIIACLLIVLFLYVFSVNSFVKIIKHSVGNVVDTWKK